MKRLFLSSSFEDVAHIFDDFAAEDLQGKRVAFIPTAALHESVDFYVEAGRAALAKRGLVISELELSTATASEAAAALENSDCIYVSGGNAFFLLQEMRRTGADKMIAAQIESGKPYIGESAGSMILSPHIEYAQAMDNREEAPDLPDFEALNVIDFYPLPHYASAPFETATDSIVASYGTSLALTPIGNAQAVTVYGDVTTMRE